MPLEQGQPRVQETPIGHFDTMVEPSVEVVLDPVGPLPITIEGYCYLLVIIDASRWIEAIPMKSNSAESMLEAFLIFVLRRGAPRSCIRTAAGTS